MKSVTIAFLIAELLDCMTTFIGLRMGMIEVNPICFSLGLLITAKIVAIGIVATVLQVKRPHKLDWLVFAIAGLPVIWNVLNITVEIL